MRQIGCHLFVHPCRTILQHNGNMGIAFLPTQNMTLCVTRYEELKQKGGSEDSYCECRTPYKYP